MSKEELDFGFEHFTVMKAEGIAIMYILQRKLGGMTNGK